MPATKREKSPRKQPAKTADTSTAPAVDGATARGRRSRRGASKPRPTGAAAHPFRVRARVAGRRIRALGDVSESLDIRRRLRQLARLVAHGSREVRGIAFVEGLLGECLDDAQTHGPRERWLECEAVTWGLAWLARTRRAGGSAGGLLERLVKLARPARETLQSRDTGPARFVLTLARLFRDIEACHCLERDATEALAEEIGRLVSTDGAIAISGEPFGSAAAIERVVRWTSLREIATLTGGSPPWDDKTEERWRAANATALRLLGADGRVLTGAGRLPASFSACLLEAAEERKGPARRTAAVIRRPPRRIAPHAARRLLKRDLHAVDSAMAIVRTGWQRRALRVLVDYRETEPRLEVAIGDRLLVDGPWSWRVSIDGRPLEAEGPWKVSGFESDRKATFLEITASLGGGMQLERQVVVLVRDAVVLLADAVTSAAPPAGRPLRIETGVSLGQALEAEQAEETRDVVVYDTTMRLMALPLALPEWTAAAGPGSLDVAAGSLVLRQESAGGRLYAPLWLDCDPARIGRPLTWRQLTVADTRRNLPRHQAAGFRVQAGLEQWLLYRTLDVPRNRTLLGCNLSCEFLVGRIGKDGVVSRTLEIE